MKRRVAIAFAVVLLAASLVPPGGALPPAPQPAVRESILIVGDEGFLDPDSGVRGGSGTPDDPYVISDWVVVGTRGVGVRLVNTSAHVVIRHVHVDPIARQWVTLVEDCGSAWCAPGAGIDLVEVANVRLEQVSIFPGAVGLAITGSHNVTVDGIDLAGPTGAEWAVMRIPVRAIEMAHSRDSLIANATVRGSAFAARLDEVVNVTIQDSLFDGYAPVVLRRTEHVTVQRNVFLGANLHVQRAPRDLLVAENVFESDPVLFAHIFYETWHEPSVTDSSVVICRNRFRGADVAVNLYGPHQARVVGNRFDGGGTGLYYNAHLGGSVSVERNAFGNHTRHAIDGGGGRVHNNSIAGNLRGVVLDPSDDARWNWWGHESGPSGAGPGSGDPIETWTTPPAFEPWLLEPPALDSCCERLDSAPHVVPTTYAHTFEYEGGQAVVVRLAVPEDASYTIRAHYTLPDVADDDLAAMTAVLLPDRELAWGCAASVRFTAKASAQLGDVQVRVAPDGIARLTITVSNPLEWPRQADFVFMAAGGDQPVTKTRVEVLVHSVQGAPEVSVPAVAPAHFRSTRDMGDHVIVRARGIGPSIAEGSALVAVERGFVGCSDYLRQGSIDERSFTVEGPAGSRNAENLFLLGAPPGDYLFRLRQRSVDAPGTAVVLWADLARGDWQSP